MRRLFVLSSLATASLVVGTTPAAAFYDYREAAYITHMYSDSSHSTEVGQITPECGYYYVQYTLSGTYTNYQVDEFVGYCTQDGWEPI